MTIGPSSYLLWFSHTHTHTHARARARAHAHTHKEKREKDRDEGYSYHSRLRLHNVVECSRAAEHIGSTNATHREHTGYSHV